MSTLIGQPTKNRDVVSGETRGQITVSNVSDRYRNVAFETDRIPEDGGSNVAPPNDLNDLNQLDMVCLDFLSADCKSTCEKDLENSLERLEDLELVPTPCLQSVLLLAVKRGLIKIAKLLLQHGLDVNTRDDSFQSLLHHATFGNHTAMVRFLLENGADIHSRDRGRSTPFLQNANLEHREVLQLLVEAGADPNSKGYQGTNPLYGAAAGGNAVEVKFLLEMGVNPSIKTDFGWAPLHWAAHNGHPECVQLLMDAAVELNPVSDQNVTPLDLAIRNHQSDIVEMLQDAGAKTVQALHVRTGKYVDR